MRIGAQRHANSSDQGFKCFATHDHEIDSQSIFLNFKAGFGNWRFTSYISYFLYPWFVHVAHRIFVTTQKQY